MTKTSCPAGKTSPWSSWTPWRRAFLWSSTTGKIEVRVEKLTGYLEENAFFTYLKQIPRPGTEELMAAFARAQETYAAYGITTVQDGMAVEEMLPMYRAIVERKLLKLDLQVYPEPACYEKALRELGGLTPEGHLSIAGIKIFLDGSPQGRTAWLRQPYEGEAEYRGYGTMSDQQVLEAMEFVWEKKTQLLCHCNGDQAAEQFLRCLEQAERRHPEFSDLRPVIIHGQLLGVDQLERVKRLGALVSFFPAHVYHWGDVHMKNLGRERAAGISPARSALQWGIPVTFHQDAPVIQPDMLETVWCAANRVTRRGVCLGPEEAVPVLEALRAVTAAGAYQYFQEKRLGTIEQGKQADFLLLDRDPLEMPAERVRELRVMGTWKAGRRIYKASGC